MGRVEKLREILSDLNNVEGVEESAIATYFGELLCSASTERRGKNIVRRATAILNQTNIQAIELGKGPLDKVITSSESGMMIVTEAGDRALLAILVRPVANLQLILLENERAKKRIEEAMTHE